jgi:predicted permease
MLVILLKFDRKKAGLFSAIFAFSNTIFVGLPVNQALFGNKAVPYVLLYYVANTTLFWTIGLYNIRKDVEDPNGDFSMYQALKKIFSAPLLGYIVGIIFILLGIKTPQFLVDTAKYIGQLTTPLSMIFIGISIYMTDLKDFKLDKNVLFLLIGRIIIAPIITILVLHLFKLNILMEKVFVIQSALPVMTQIAIVAHAYKSDQKYPSIMIAATNLLSLIVVPIYMYIISNIF